jgi:hypothetical protein
MGAGLRVLITDLDQGTAEPEAAVFREHGIELALAQARTQDEVIEAAADTLTAGP